MMSSELIETTRGFKLVEQEDGLLVLKMNCTNMITSFSHVWETFIAHIKMILNLK